MDMLTIKGVYLVAADHPSDNPGIELQWLRSAVLSAKRPDDQILLGDEDEEILQQEDVL